MGYRRLAVIILITGVILAVIPGYLWPDLPVNIRGSVEPGWEKVEEVFRRHVETGEQKGGSFAVYYKGERVVNLMGGYADHDAQKPWTEDTICQFFSTTKGISALVIAMLVDRGYLKYSSPVVEYWPEFGAHGKENITIEELFSHQAGLPILDAYLTQDDIRFNSGALSTALANQKPLWPPGDRIGYHVITIGLYQDQIVRRVDPQHRSISQIFKDELAGPLALDFYIGLPEEQHGRCAKVVPTFLNGVAFAQELQRHPDLFYMIYEVLQINCLFWKTIIPSDFPMLINDRSTREVPNPSVSGFGNTDSVAKLFGMVANGGQYQGTKYFSAEILDKLDDVMMSGTDEVLPWLNMTYGRGFTLLPNGDGTGLTFGTPGIGGQMGYGDLRNQLGWAYVSNHHLASLETDTYKELWRAMYDSVSVLQDVQ